MFEPDNGEIVVLPALFSSYEYAGTFLFLNNAPIITGWLFAKVAESVIRKDFSDRVKFRDGFKTKLLMLPPELSGQSFLESGIPAHSVRCLTGMYNPIFQEWRTAF